MRRDHRAQPTDLKVAPFDDLQSSVRSHLQSFCGSSAGLKFDSWLRPYSRSNSKARSTMNGKDSPSTSHAGLGLLPL